MVGRQSLSCDISCDDVGNLRTGYCSGASRTKRDGIERKGLWSHSASEEKTQSNSKGAQQH